MRNINDNITKYFESVLILIIGLIPPAVGLLLFDHSALSESDILITAGMWFWAGVCIFYSATFIGLYSISLPLIHPMIWKFVNIEYMQDPDDWKAVTLHMVLWSVVSGVITWCKEGNFIHFVGNSFIVCFSTNVVLLLSYLYLKRQFPNNTP